MKTKITTIITLLAFAFTLSAQKGNVSSADYELTVENPDLEKAEEKILAAETHEKTINYSKTYIVKERVYRAKYTKDNNVTDNLFTAFDAIVKAEELDIKGNKKGRHKLKFKDEIKKDLVLLRIDFQNCGANAYNDKDYEMSMKCFEKVLAIDQMPSAQEEGVPANIDTGIIFNTAICAYYSENKEKTSEYMLQCMEYGYGESTPHTVMYMHYKEAGDTVKMVETLKDGFEKYPNDATFLKELVVHYINANDLEEGMKYINLALASDPSNSSFWFTKGTFHDQAGEQEKAIEAYGKALESAVTDDERYNANYNLAVIYYNIAVEAANAANDEKDMKKSQDMGEVAKDKFRECVPFFENCLESKPNDLETLKALRPVYYRLSDDAAVMAKYEELQKNIKALEELE
ncbi:MAG: hypothetical protein PF444_02160 [Bacteroidales bacterium]|jgi:tetratricopeptide (TPR) repeat protein|nr:hypothetical protein [Bacteroidales bacterium]